MERQSEEMPIIVGMAIGGRKLRTGAAAKDGWSCDSALSCMKTAWHRMGWHAWALTGACGSENECVQMPIAAFRT